MLPALGRLDVHQRSPSCCSAGMLLRVSVVIGASCFLPRPSQAQHDGLQEYVGELHKELAFLNAVSVHKTVGVKQCP